MLHPAGADSISLYDLKIYICFSFSPSISFLLHVSLSLFYPSSINPLLSILFFAILITFFFCHLYFSLPVAFFPAL